MFYYKKNNVGNPQQIEHAKKNCESLYCRSGLQRLKKIDKIFSPLISLISESLRTILSIMNIFIDGTYKNPYSVYYRFLNHFFFHDSKNHGLPKADYPCCIFFSDGSMYSKYSPFLIAT